MTNNLFAPGDVELRIAVQQLDHVDMDGPLLLDEDIATGLLYDYGQVRISGKPGLGIDLIPAPPQ